MKVYTWRCEQCNNVQDVERASMDDYLLPPDSCEKCSSTGPFTKLISRQGTPVLKGSGWHRDEYTKTRSIK